MEGSLGLMIKVRVCNFDRYLSLFIADASININKITTFILSDTIGADHVAGIADEVETMAIRKTYLLYSMDQLHIPSYSHSICAIFKPFSG